MPQTDTAFAATSATHEWAGLSLALLVVFAFAFTVTVLTFATRPRR